MMVHVQNCRMSLHVFKFIDNSVKQCTMYDAVLYTTLN